MQKPSRCCWHCICTASIPYLHHANVLAQTTAVWDTVYHCRPKVAAARRLSSSSSPVISKAAKQQVLQGSTYEEIIEQLAHHALDAAQANQGSSVYLVGIAGSPGSGKSTLAQQVAQRITQLCQQRGLSRTAAVAPMDGFHYYKQQLDAMPDPQEAYARRGAHWTFDGNAFVAAVRRLKQHGAASLPSFDHGVGDPVEDDIHIDSAQHAVVLVEGNYLLLELEPWVQLRGVFDDAWFVDCPVDLAMQRVFDRQVAIGLAPEVSLGRIEGNDKPNALLVNAVRALRDCWCRQPFHLQTARLLHEQVLQAVLQWRQLLGQKQQQQQQSGREVEQDSRVCDGDHDACCCVWQQQQQQQQQQQRCAALGERCRLQIAGANTLKRRQILL
ncbi:P-loop containing nucleoside triphosphate hydrolase protein [Scenedesmus sp. NREL 46B-D3]|nr:P-loop containing nucleoside triphosphate hydrolase protein [Scenedesmus sp. NREL 46B-D3]